MHCYKNVSMQPHFFEVGLDCILRGRHTDDSKQLDQNCHFTEKKPITISSQLNIASNLLHKQEHNNITQQQQQQQQQQPRRLLPLEVLELNVFVAFITFSWFSLRLKDVRPGKCSWQLVRSPLQPQQQPRNQHTRLIPFPVHRVLLYKSLQKFVKYRVDKGKL